MGLHWGSPEPCPDSEEQPMAAYPARAPRRSSIVLLTAIALLAAGLAAPAASAAPPSKTSEKAVFFASDGMRQDAVAAYAAKGLLPTMSDFLKKGVKASGNGLLTQAPPNTGAGWYTLATGAWPGVHGSTNNTFYKSGSSGNSFTGARTAAFDPGVLQAETIAQSAERAGLEGRPGRMGRWPQRDDQRSDDRLPVVPVGPRHRHQLRRSGRSARQCRGLRLAVRPPRRLCRTGRVPRRGTEPGHGLDPCPGLE